MTNEELVGPGDPRQDGSFRAPVSQALMFRRGGVVAAVRVKRVVVALGRDDYARMFG